jgi:hypothetical protein
MNQIGVHIQDTFFSGRGAVAKRPPRLRADVVAT